MFQALVRISFAALVAMTALVGFASPTTAAPPGLLAAIGDFAGDVTIDGVGTGPLPILSFSTGVSTSGATTPGGGGGAGKATFTPFKITKLVDATSPKLLLNAATGRRIPKVTVRARKKGGGESYLVVTMHDVLISSYQTSGAGSAPSTEEVSFVFTRISFEAGGQVAGYDLAENRPF